VFSVGLLASLTMLLAFQRLNASATAAPGYALGMALGNLVMSRLYAVTMRPVEFGVTAWQGRLRIPWIVWRGNHQAVRNMNELAARVRAAGAQTAEAAHRS
jgi:hypothetical protein